MIFKEALIESASQFGKESILLPVHDAVLMQFEADGNFTAKIENSFSRIKRPQGGNQKIVFDVAGELLRKSPHYGKGSAPASRPCIRLDDLIEACHGRLTVPEDRWRERTRLAITGLVNAGCLMLRENWVWDR